MAEISQKLQVPLDASVIVQSHSPFAELVNGSDEESSLRDKCVMVVGGEGDGCRRVAEVYALAVYLDCTRSILTIADTGSRM